MQSCETCLRWQQGADTQSAYGTCHARRDPLPFWAVKHQPGMHTRTQRHEGEDCPAYQNAASFAHADAA